MSNFGEGKGRDAAWCEYAWCPENIRVFFLETHSTALYPQLDQHTVSVSVDDSKLLATSKTLSMGWRVIAVALDECPALYDLEGRRYFQNSTPATPPPNQDQLWPCALKFCPLRTAARLLQNKYLVALSHHPRYFVTLIVAFLTLKQRICS